MRSVRFFLTLMVGVAAALVAYGALYNHFRPHAGVADPQLAFKMIPLELVFGALMAWWVYRAFERKLADNVAPRGDIQERMLYRLLARKGGKISLQDVRQSSPLSESDARSLLQKWAGEGKVRALSDEEFQLL